MARPRCSRNEPRTWRSKSPASGGWIRTRAGPRPACAYPIASSHEPAASAAPALPSPTRNARRSNVVICVSVEAAPLLAAAAQLVDLFRERLDVRAVHGQRGDDDLFRRRDERAIATHRLGHLVNRLVPELERLLHHRRVDRARADAPQRLVGFVERDDLHPPDLADRKSTRLNSSHT